MTTQTDSTYSIQDVLANLKKIGLPPEWDDGTNLLAASLYREIAKGAPVEPATVEKLISAAGVDPETGSEFIAGVTEKDDSGNVVGAIGLSQNQYAHEFRVNGVNLTTWCAWDTLFIAQVLGQTANVTSHAPGSGEEITLEITPERAVSNPPEAVVSFVLLDSDQIDMDSMESIYMVFCHQVLFFPSREAAEKWSADSKYEFAIMSVDDAFQIGAVAFANLIKAAQNEPATK